MTAPFPIAMNKLLFKLSWLTQKSYRRNPNDLNTLRHFVGFGSHDFLKYMTAVVTYHNIIQNKQNKYIYT